MSDEPTKPSPAPKPFLLLKSIVSRVPLSDSDQEKAAKLISQCTLEELQSLNLGPPPRPIPPKFTATAADKVPPQQRLSQVQRVISSLQYNHHAGYFYNVSKDRPWSRVMDTARELLATALPIKCIEAVFLGAYLTAGWLDLDRIPIGFKSRSHQDQEVHRHIVLVVRHFPSGKYGALGISRRKELMDKELKFESLRDILTNYRESYDMWGHKLLKVYVGLPLDHDLLYNGMAIWRYLHLNAAKHKWSKCCNQLDLFEGTDTENDHRY
uniref:Vasohibin-like protein n=1 Tax=Polytomella parva TaxID=51329 RepID=A0A7S0YJS4_9CHLO|mmetsp:Transcript_32833/g.59503  ORF Transcript_32833/g.59503 Transcript_32833/m.59503 type:complete len:268 (+) Transcript_32833:187-990(+)